MTRNKTGFTLVEIALAILVVAIGVLAIFALLSAGLDNSVRAIEDTHAAMFADNVFNGLRAVTVAAAERQNQLVRNPSWDPTWGNTNCPWESFWLQFTGGKTSITVAAGEVWPKAGSAQLAITASSGESDIKRIAFTNVTLRGAETNNIVDHGLRYNLLVASKLGAWNKLWTNTARVTLKVWPGLFGKNPPREEDALVFYSEFANPGDL